MNIKKPSFCLIIALCFSLFSNQLPIIMAQTNNVSFESLSAGKKVSGFRADAVYLNEADQPMGGRFIHERTGFTLDLLQIQSVPQVYMWVKSFPTSDMGEPHTQEHLLLGKGNKGRSVASLEDMSLAASNASTYQWYTTYHFNTTAGADVFYKLIEREIDALLYPDYTDEEILREVRNFGVVENPADKTLRLEEKGSVYNEMVSSMDQPDWRVYTAMGHLLYGRQHPLSYSAGGLPAAIREMKPDDIKKFHRENYHLGNMGAIASLPKEMPPADSLSKMDAILNRLEPKTEKREYMSAEKLSSPKMAETGKIQTIEYPNENAQQPGTMLFAYPPTLKLSVEDLLLLEYFIDNLAGDATTNLYKKFIDTKTREMDLGAKGIYASVEKDIGHPIYIGLTDVTAANLTEEKAVVARQKILDEIARIAAMKDNSPELIEFNNRLKNRIIEDRRQLAKFVNSPPGFGFRNTGNEWLSQIQILNKTSDFRKSVTLKPQISSIEKMLDGGKNIWSGYIAKWKLAETKPFVVMGRANPKLIEQEERERKARADSEVERLKLKYKITNVQEAIRRYKAEYDANTAELERLEKTSATRFLENPPLTLDDNLDYKVTTLPNDIKLVASTFDNMTSATVGLALRLDGVPENELVYLSALPTLLGDVGVIKDGKAVSFEEMSEMLRREILSLNLSYSLNSRTGRFELVVRGSGNDPAESQRAVEWMRLVLQNPNWQKENLPRLRDVIDQTLSGLRNRMQSPEEYWVNDPANAYRWQKNLLTLATASFLTQTHNVHRLRWMLKDAGDAENRQAIGAFLGQLANAKGSRSELKTLLAAMQGDTAQAGKISASLKPEFDAFTKLPETAKNLAVEAAKDLDQILADIPDSSLAADWAYLNNQIRQDLLKSPEQTLTDLNNLRRRILKTGNARMFVIGSRDTQQKLDANIRSLIAGLENAPATKANYTAARLIDERLKTRLGDKNAPVFVGLLNPNTQGGVFLNSVPSATYLDIDREKLLEFLASRIYGGGGAHSIFMKTWGAGLAYSNGLRSAPSSGLLHYYAERTPELPQTLRFVIDELKKSPRDATLSEYAIAQALGESRAASGYEARGEAMASDLADGITPETVQRFRSAVLELRKMPNLAEELYRRMDTVYARVLPGYEGKAGNVKDGVFYVIGPEKQLSAYEAYLKSVGGTDTNLYRLYPRDYWMPMK